MAKTEMEHPVRHLCSSLTIGHVGGPGDPTDNIKIAEFAVITAQPGASRRLCRDLLGLPLQQQDQYLFISNDPGVQHFRCMAPLHGRPLLFRTG